MKIKCQCGHYEDEDSTIIIGDGEHCSNCTDLYLDTIGSERCWNDEEDELIDE